MQLTTIPGNLIQREFDIEVGSPVSPSYNDNNKKGDATGLRAIESLGSLKALTSRFLESSLSKLYIYIVLCVCVYLALYNIQVSKNCI